MRVLTLALVVLWTVGAAAQSLGEVARQEAERRKTVKAPGKTYTNEQLKAEPRGSAPPISSPDSPAPGAAAGTPVAPAPATPAPATPGAGQTPAGAQPGSPTQSPKDEAGWRSRIQSARETLSRAQIFADALQSRINGLSTDFTARDDPAQRAVVGANRQKSLDELARVQKEIQQHTKALADIQEEGRRAGVPAGWLR